MVATKWRPFITEPESTHDLLTGSQGQETKQYDNCLMEVNIEDIVSYTNTQYQKVCVYLNVFVYISRDFSSLEMYRRHFVSLPSLHREYHKK